MSACAVIKNEDIEVINTIVADSSFELEGFYLVEYDRDSVFCQKGMFYNAKDGVFYDDKNFKTINGV